MPQDRPDDDTAATWFEVTGWHGERATKIRLAHQADLNFWQRVIAYEKDAIEQRFDAVLARADKASTNYQKAQKLREPDFFDLSVRRMDSPQENRIEAKKAADRPAGKVTWEEPLAGRFLEGDLAPCPVLAVGCPPHHRLLMMLEQSGGRIEHVAPGEGQVQAARCGLDDRYRAAAQSFAGWLASVAPSEREAIAIILMGPNAGALDIECLRYRLFGHQRVIVEAGTAIAQRLEEAWDGRIETFADGLLFSGPGPAFLDPMIGNPSIDWPKISVVTVSYNQADYLEDCLRSVLDQDYPNLEYIVIDAVSTDGSLDILRRYEDRISKLIIEPDGGQSEGLNKGFDLATGDIFTWINSDDMLAPGALRRAALAFRDYGADLVAGGCERIGEKSDDVLFRHHAALPFMQVVPLGLGENYMWTSAWEQGDYVFQPEVLFTAEIWRRSGGYLKRHLYWAMDWELWLRMAMAGATIVNLPDVIGRSRQQDNQKTRHDELYLFQIRNILVEHNQALTTLKMQTADLPLGRPRAWTPELTKKVTMAAHADRLKRLWTLRDPRRLWQALSKRLPAGVTRRILSLRRRFNYRLGRPRLVSGVTYARWSRLNNTLAELEAETRQARRDHQALLAERDVLKQHCDDLKAVIKSKFSKKEEMPAVDGADPIAEFLMTFLFDEEASPADRQLVKSLLTQGQSVKTVARNLAVQHFSLQSRPSFELAQPLLRVHQPFPDLADPAHQLDHFRIVDVGSETLSFENHIYTPLLKRWAAVVLGFDPFGENGSETRTTVGDGGHECRVRTLKTFVGSGQPATFHMNRMRATSSLLSGNQDLAAKFSLLGEALETTDRQAVETSRLDDLLANDSDFGGAIDFLKVDVQGGSLQVLEGATACLARTLVCHVEAEFSEIYRDEKLFSEIDRFMRGQGFVLLDFARLGRQRYKSFDSSATYFFQAGRLLWADCIYVRHLDKMTELSTSELLKLAIICHEIYQKPDCTAEALGFYDERTNTLLRDDFIDSQDLGKAVEGEPLASSGQGD